MTGDDAAAFGSIEWKFTAEINSFIKFRFLVITTVMNISSERNSRCKDILCYIDTILDVNALAVTRDNLFFRFVSINQSDGIFCYIVYTYSLSRLTPVRYLAECLRDSSRGCINISVIDIPFDLGSCSCMCSENCASWFRISVSDEGEKRREERGRSVCVAARKHVHCAFIYVCVHVHVYARTYMCVRAFASCGFVVCPEGRTTNCLRSLVLFASLRPSPIRRDLTPRRPSSLFPFLRGSTHRSPACV